MERGVPICGRRVLRSSTTPPAAIRPRAGSGKPHEPATTKEFPVGHNALPVSATDVHDAAQLLDGIIERTPLALSLIHI